MQIKLIPATEINTTIPLLQYLNPTLTHETLAARLSDMLTQGYQCVGAWDENKEGVNKKLIGICGMWILTKCYVGRHLEVDNVIVHPDYQGQGIGKALLDWAHDYAKAQGCLASELNCYVTNQRGHLFWAHMGYTHIAQHFQKRLN